MAELPLLRLVDILAHEVLGHFDVRQSFKTVPKAEEMDDIELDYCYLATNSLAGYIDYYPEGRVQENITDENCYLQLVEKDGALVEDRRLD